ncbi:MAG: hypothetical protein UT11_C0005G0003 [Berkelbacteria bacterium GW2011_GWA2_38_9]|uniref:DUF202 domain-containing protein n=1 Tax=Berkelbacteria bacterium GW2011_GWA2_38_9 TaxID=1618334 RepID=A0A0G0LHC1_9BACT|nr:MAG: hypothetical protein UT11_C0005G0003 [Berkelbacteria bacterium GW2011_GWA2_38_9]
MNNFIAGWKKAYRHDLTPEEKENLTKYYQRCRKTYIVWILAFLSLAGGPIYMIRKEIFNPSIFYFSSSLFLLFLGVGFIWNGKISQQMKIFHSEVFPSLYPLVIGAAALFGGKIYFYLGWAIVAISVILFLIGWWI